MPDPFPASSPALRKGCATLPSGRNAFACPAADVVRELSGSAERGLDDAQVEAARAQVGWNELAAAPATPLWKKFAAQLNEVVIWLLVGAAVVSGALGEWADTAAILAIVVLNALLGFIQEERAERSLAALEKMSAPAAKVVRGGHLRALPARELVPGDLVEIEAGDRVPADARLIRSSALRTLEAALTGESTPVDKAAERILPEDAALGDRANMVYQATIVATGTASAIVTATGMETELGRTAGLLVRHKPQPTPLQRRLAELGKVLLVVCGVIAAVIFALEALRGERLAEAVLLSVSLAVAAVPEGLPAVVTIALALGLSRMVRKNALIRKLPSVETLGSVTVICSDKTGTLTRNQMTVREIVGDRRRVLEIGVICNNAHLEGDTLVGDPTEGALLVAARAEGIEPARAVVSERPFDSDRKMMSVVTPGGALLAKGAPEVILARSIAELRDGRVEPLTDARRADIVRVQSELSARALRVLAMAYHERSDADERDLVFAGLVGMMDPPRDEAKAAVARCQQAGIRPVLITGDHPQTALAIARELGIASGAVRSGPELEKLSDAELATEVEQIAVYARVTAEHKLRVVRAWQARGQVVAMTGDGVNDAPALKVADIGIAMGRSGTDVTREAADMVLTDDNFASIVNAVEEGRGIYDNIQKVVTFLLSCNIGEVLFMFATALAGWPLPLMPIQLLWINLVTDGLPALALGMEPPERDLMSRPPRPPRERVLTLRRTLVTLGIGALVAACAAVGFAMVYAGDPARLPRARTMAFSVLTFGQLLLAFAFRSQRHVMPQLGVWTNPPLLGAIVVSALLQLSVVMLPIAQPIFDTARHLGNEWWLLAGLSLAPVTVVELVKLVRS